MTAVINIKMFDLWQHIYIFDEKNPSQKTVYDTKNNEIPLFLANLEELKSVHLFGNEDFINGIIQEIKTKEFQRYNSNKIDFFINE